MTFWDPKLPRTNKYECPECGDPLDEVNDRVEGDLYFCCNCSQYCVVEREKTHG